MEISLDDQHTGRAQVADKIPYLDGWRGLAILFVLAFHFLEPPFASISAFGVFLFFALSGLFMAQMLFIRKMDLRTFFIRRFSRVVPTFWLFTICIIIYAAHFQAVRYDMPAEEIATTMLFLRTYFPVDMSIWINKLPIGHFWSLNVEEHSYLLLAFGAFLFNRSVRRWTTPAFLIAVTLITLAINVVYINNPPVTGSPWFVRSEAASIAILTSACYCLIKARVGWSLFERIPAWFPVVCFFLAAGMVMSAKMPLIVTSFFLLALSINHLDVAPKICQTLLSTRIMRWFGKTSFSIYLWQQPFYVLVDAHPQYRYLYLAMAIATGAVSFYCFENPMRHWINSSWDSRRRVTTMLPSPSPVPEESAA